MHEIVAHDSGFAASGPYPDQRLTAPADRIRVAAAGLLPTREQVAEKVADLAPLGQGRDTYIAAYLAAAVADLLTAAASADGIHVDSHTLATLTRVARDAAALILADAETR